MRHKDNRSEELFARLCSDIYYGGFIYQNPKYVEGNEKEAGDVVLWVRDWLVIFEIVWRATSATSNSKSFIKRIGEKRDQLLGDFRVYADGDFNIHMTNEAGEATLYDQDYYNEDTTRGVILIDAPSIQGKLHFETLRLTLEAPHPIAIITRNDFEAILSEVDTPADLGFYLGDRHRFLRRRIRMTLRHSYSSVISWSRSSWACTSWVRIALTLIGGTRQPKSVFGIATELSDVKISREGIGRMRTLA